MFKQIEFDLLVVVLIVVEAVACTFTFLLLRVGVSLSLSLSLSHTHTHTHTHTFIHSLTHACAHLLSALISRLSKMGLGETVVKWLDGESCNSFFEFKLAQDTVTSTYVCTNLFMFYCVVVSSIWIRCLIAPKLFIAIFCRIYQ